MEAQGRDPHARVTSTFCDVTRAVLRDPYRGEFRGELRSLTLRGGARRGLQVPGPWEPCLTDLVKAPIVPHGVPLPRCESDMGVRAPRELAISWGARRAPRGSGTHAHGLRLPGVLAVGRGVAGPAPRPPGELWCPGVPSGRGCSPRCSDSSCPLPQPRAWAACGAPASTWRMRGLLQAAGSLAVLGWGALVSRGHQVGSRFCGSMCSIWGRSEMGLHGQESRVHMVSAGPSSWRGAGAPLLASDPSPQSRPEPGSLPGALRAGPSQEK